MNRLLRVLLVLSIIHLMACSNFGATQLPPDRISYNSSMQYSESQQMLLNIVRLRYTDIPYFLVVSNVVSQMSISKELSLSVVNGTIPALVGTGNGSLTLSESPTITYTPLQGETYVTKLMTTIDLSILYRMIRSGWGTDKVLRLFAQRIGPYDNAVLASRQTSNRVPKFKAFQAWGLALRQLEYDGHLKVETDKIDGHFAIKLTVDNMKTLKPSDRKFVKKMGLTQKDPSFWLVSTPKTKAHQYYVQVRTVLELLNYLSKGVDVPVEDLMANIARTTYDQHHRPFDWHLITHGQLCVRFSKLRPNNAYIAVRYRNYWFYVADNDVHSKETINMLSVIMGIYEGDVKSVLPIFTVS